MHPLKSKKSVLFLVMLIVILYMSQYVFPTPNNQNANESTPANEVTPEQIEQSIDDPKTQGPTNDVKDVIPDPVPEPKESSQSDEDSKSKRAIASNENSEKEELSEEESELIKKIMTPEMIQELYDEIANFSPSGEVSSSEADPTDGNYINLKYSDGGQLKQGYAVDGSYDYFYQRDKALVGKHHYQDGGVRTYIYKNGDGYVSGIGYYPSGEIKFRIYQDPSLNSAIRVAYLPNGKIENVSWRDR
ncbi:MAG: hypothetical protein MJK18_01510 [Bdellovibrionales bacterium]|nr:hypothetical protein [Bdellovibrionales bacterium]